MKKEEIKPSQESFEAQRERILQLIQDAKTQAAVFITELPTNEADAVKSSIDNYITAADDLWNVMHLARDPEWRNRQKESQSRTP